VKAVVDFLIASGAFRTDGPFILASGRESPMYVDVKRALLAPGGAHDVGRAVLYRALDLPGTDRGFGFAGDDGAGLLLGAVLGLMPVTYAADRGAGPSLWVRRPKDHGVDLVGRPASAASTRRPDPQPVPCQAVVVEDVTTTGASAMAVVDRLRPRGVAVLGVVSVVDRNEGATEAFARAGVAFAAVTTLAALWEAVTAKVG
jgi:orotate phosphoribosyltransferase